VTRPRKPAGASAGRRDRDRDRDRGGRRTGSGERTEGPAPASGLGGDQVEGRRAVHELLVAQQRRVKSVYVSSTAEDLDDIAELAGAQLRIVPPERLVGLAKTDAPQGVVAIAAPLQSTDLVRLLREPDAFLVALDGVTDPHNLGAILRTAETAGVTGMILPRRRSAHVTATVTKTAAGAIEHMPIALVSGIGAALERAAREKVWSVGLDGDAERMIDDIAVATEPVVVVLGAEGRGLSRLVRERCDLVVQIPMHGHIESLNVSAAAAIVLHRIAALRHP
jgi:23S rRNA (guanosine2251-2'-O)-methyltransferase